MHSCLHACMEGIDECIYLSCIFMCVSKWRIFMIMQAAAVAAFARMTVEDSRKLLPDPYYPSWVVFSERQKLSCWMHYVSESYQLFVCRLILIHACMSDISILFILQLDWLNQHIAKMWPYIDEVHCYYLSPSLFYLKALFSSFSNFVQLHRQHQGL